MITKPRDHSPTKSIAGLSLCGASNNIDILNDQIDAISEENNELEEAIACSLIT